MYSSTFLAIFSLAVRALCTIVSPWPSTLIRKNVILGLYRDCC